MLSPTALRARARLLPRGEVAVVVVLVVLSGLLHAWNMLGYPYFENDEATYLSRGWVFVTEGRLDVTTYRYDHAPVGWMLVGAWLWLTGGDALAPSFLVSGRVLMLIVHLVSTVLLYLIARRMSGGRILPAVIAVLVFAASPLGIYYQRRVLLDNLMVMWLLISVLLALRDRRHLTDYVGSGIAFGFAVLTKLNAVFFGPGMLVLLLVVATRHQRRHALAHWLAFAGATVAFFFLYAIINDEFLPAPRDPDGQPLRVSLLETFGLQLGRGTSAPAWSPDSSFAAALASWRLDDPFTLVLGAVCTVAAVVLGVVFRRRAPFLAVAAALVLGYTLFLVRGGIVLNLYIVPLLPFLALVDGLVIGLLVHRVSAALAARRRMRRHAEPTRSGVLAPVVGGAVVLGLGAAYLTAVPTIQYELDETGNQTRAIDWIEQNVPESAIIAADNYVYPSLAQEDGFDRTGYFFSMEYDPELRRAYGDDWRDIDYLVLTHEVVQQIREGAVPRMRELLDHSELVADFTDGSTSYLDLPQYLSTNGDWAQVYRTSSRVDIVRQDAWAHFRDEFVRSYGQVVEPDNGGVTTSNGQASAMREALAQDDEATFRGIWKWTTDHLRHREKDALTSWQWVSDGPDDAVGSLGNPDTNCAADLRFAVALQRASTAWDDAGFAEDSRALTADWWRECTFERGGLTLIDSSADGSDDVQLVNPSFFDPVLLRELQQTDPRYDWSGLIDDGYAFLDRVLDERGTVPDWVAIDTRDRLVSASPIIAGDPDGFGDDSLALVRNLLSAERDGDAAASSLVDRLVPALESEHAVEPRLPLSVTLALVAQQHDIGRDAQRIVDAELFPFYDSATGAFASGTSKYEHDWGVSWFAAQSALPAEQRVPVP